MQAVNPTSLGLDQNLVEDLNRRTQHSKQFRNPNNSRTITSYISSNQHYQPGPGEWEPQNLNFQLQ